MKRFLVFCIMMIIFVSCNIPALTPAPSSPPALSSTSPDPETPAPTPSQANGYLTIGEGQFGDMLGVPAEDAWMEPLRAPSCLGEETDYILKGGFHVVFRNRNDEEKDITHLDDPVILKNVFCHAKLPQKIVSQFPVIQHSLEK